MCVRRIAPKQQDATIKYLNTDFDLVSTEDLAPLAAALESRGVFLLHVTQDEDGLWRARFETTEQHSDPETNIAAMVSTVESLSEPHRLIWKRCLERNFNVGYECDTENVVLIHSLSTEMLARLASVGASLGLTLYPNESAA